MVNEASQTKMDDARSKVMRPTAIAGLAIFGIINIVMIVIGAMKLGHCPINRMVPIYLLVAGITGIAAKFLHLINREKERKFLTSLACLIHLFEFIWMIIGSYWIYSIYEPNYDQSLGEFCDKGTYLTAFWLLTINYILLILYITIPILIVCCLCFLCIAD